jgi:peptide/nickel transport system permease protein
LKPGAGRRGTIAASIRRAALGFLTVWLVATATFVLVSAAPGDPAAALLGDDGDAEARALLATSFGFDRPAFAQYVTWVGHLARFDLGTSISFRAPVTTVILDRLPATLSLMLPALLLSSLLGAVLGLPAAALRRGGLGSGALVTGAVLAAVPVYVLGQSMILLFALWLGWFPLNGLSDARLSSGGLDGALDTLRHLVLPTVTLALHQVVILWLFIRARAREEGRSGYFRTARAKGLTTAQAYRRHVWPNVQLGFLHFVAAELGSLLAGAVLVENVFGIAGMGRLVVSASLARDVPLAAGIFVLVASLVVVANVAADLVSTIVDPRLDESRRDAL